MPDDLFDDAPTLPASELPASVADLARAGMTDAEISAATGVPLHMVATSPDVLQPMTDLHDARVQRALYSAAVGGEAWSEKLDRFGDVHTVREYRAPDARAAMQWLERRQPAAWGEAARPVTYVVVERAQGRASASHALPASEPALQHDEADADADRGGAA